MCNKSSIVQTVLLLLLLALGLISALPPNKPTNPTTTPEPISLDDFYLADDEAWLEIDDMYVVNKYYRSGLSDISFRWENGIIPYSFQEGDFAPEQKELIVSVMNHFSKFTCIRFVNNDDNTYENYLHIRNGRGFQAAVGNTRTGGQWFLVETNDRSVSQTHPSYLYTGALAHELMHAIGFEHEHQRDDRDTYINIHYDNTDNSSGVKRNFMKGSELGIAQENFSVPYNYESIMQYPKSAFSNNWKDVMTPVKELPPGVPYPMVGAVDSDGFPVLGQTSYLSRGDILMVQNMYAGICPETDQFANGGPLTTNTTINRFIKLPKPWQLQPAQGTTASPTAATTTSTAATTTSTASTTTTESTTSSATTTTTPTTETTTTATIPSNSSVTYGNSAGTTAGAVDTGLGVVNTGTTAAPVDTGNGMGVVNGLRPNPAG